MSNPNQIPKYPIQLPQPTIHNSSPSLSRWATRGGAPRRGYVTVQYIEDESEEEAHGFQPDGGIHGVLLMVGYTMI